MKRLAPLFLFLLVIFSGSAFASAENCGMSVDGKSLKSFDSEICPQNIAQKIRIAFFGESIYTSILENKNNDSSYEEIQADSTQSQKDFNTRTIESFSTMKILIFGVVLIFLIVIIFNSVITLTKAIFGKEFSTDESNNPPRYNFFVAVGVMGLGAFSFIPGFFGHNGSLSVSDYFNLAAGQGALQLENMVISTYLSNQLSGGLEVPTVGESVAEANKRKENSNVYYSAKATIAGFVSTSLVISSSSAFNNSIENLHNNTTDWRVRDKTVDVWQPNNNDGIDFEHRFAEDPNQTMWSADPITFAQNPESMGENLPYLKAIGYNQNYRDYAVKDNLYNKAELLKVAIKEAYFKDSEAGFKEVANTAVSLFFKDAQANILKTEFLGMMAKSDEIALQRINYTCSLEESHRIEAKNFIDAHTGTGSAGAGSSECVSADWKVMGTEASEVYAAKVKELTLALIDEYYNIRLAINAQLQQAMYSTDIVNRVKETRQKAALNFFWTHPSLTNDLNFTQSAQSEFNITSPIQTIQTKAMGTFVDDDWAKSHGYPEAKLMIGEDFRDLKIDTQDKGTPTLKDSKAIMQSLYNENATASGQNAEFMQATGLSLANPQIKFDECRASTIYPITCVQKYGQQISETMIDIAEVAIAMKLIGYGATHIGDKKKQKLMSEQAKADEKAGVSKSKLSKKAKAKRNQPNFLQKVGSFMSTFANFFLKASLFGYIFALVLKFLMTTLMIGPFYVLYVLNMFYSLLVFLTSAFALLAFLRFNDMNNLKLLAKTVWSFFLSNLFFGPLILVFYIVNWEIAAILDRNLSTIIASGFSSAIGSDTSTIIQHLITLFVSFVCFMAINIGCLRYSLIAMNTVLEIVGLDMPHIKYTQEFISRMIFVTNIITFSMFHWLDVIITSQARSAFKRKPNFLSRFGRRGRG